MKRKTYSSRLQGLISEAKAETLALLKERGIKQMDITDQGVYVIGEDGNLNLQFYHVTKVTVGDNGMGEVLGWDCDAPEECGCFYDNPILWIEILEAVYRDLGIYLKTFDILK